MVRNRAKVFLKEEQGQTLVEFAIVLPVLLVLLLGVVSVSFYLNAYLTVAQATRVGVRDASLGYSSGVSSGTCPEPSPTGTICQAVSNQIALGAGMSASNLTSVCVSQTSPGGEDLPVVQLRVDYAYTPILPVPYLGNPVQLTQDYTMVQETVPSSGTGYPSSCP